MTPQKTIKRSELRPIRMVGGNENTVKAVILDGRVKEWVAIGWIDAGEATLGDYQTLPVVED